MTLTKEEFTRRYPGGCYETYLRMENVTKAFYNRPQEEINKDLAAEAEENSRRGWSNE